MLSNFLVYLWFLPLDAVWQMRAVHQRRGPCWSTGCLAGAAHRALLFLLVAGSSSQGPAWNTDQKTHLWFKKTKGRTNSWILGQFKVNNLTNSRWWFFPFFALLLNMETFHTVCVYLCYFFSTLYISNHRESFLYGAINNLIVKHFTIWYQIVENTNGWQLILYMCVYVQPFQSLLRGSCSDLIHWNNKIKRTLFQYSWGSTL